MKLLTYVATKNRGKLAELEAIFTGSMLELATYVGYAEVAEGESSFEENALLKARALAAQLADAGIKAAVLADDSGLEVEALGGRPGVVSARYAGANATWEERRRALLAELCDVPDERRGARFVCVIAFIGADGTMLTTQGTIDGHIGREERGMSGFGYDPVFIPDGETQTFSEMGEEKKNTMSHRRRAAAALLERLHG